MELDRRRQGGAAQEAYRTGIAPLRAVSIEAVERRFRHARDKLIRRSVIASEAKQSTVRFECGFVFRRRATGGDSFIAKVAASGLLRSARNDRPFDARPA
jgi:hypothetical protein